MSSPGPHPGLSGAAPPSCTPGPPVGYYTRFAANAFMTESMGHTYTQRYTGHSSHLALRVAGTGVQGGALSCYLLKPLPTQQTCVLLRVRLRPEVRPQEGALRSRSGLRPDSPAEQGSAWGRPAHPPSVPALGPWPAAPAHPARQCPGGAAWPGLALRAWGLLVTPVPIQGSQVIFSLARHRALRVCPRWKLALSPPLSPQAV